MRAPVGMCHWIVRGWPLTGLAALLAGCAGNSAVPGPAMMSATPGLNQEDFGSVSESEYALRPTDILQVSVFREPELSIGEIPVGADGRISLPLLGSVQVAGLTPSELQDRLQDELGSRFLRDPQVSVNVLEYASHRATVEGAVKEPGVYVFKPGTRLTGGIAMAKGIDRVAAMEDIAVFRESPDGVQIAKFDLGAIRTGNMADPVLQPGDRIVVGTDNLSQAWQDALKALPVLGLFARF